MRFPQLSHPAFQHEWSRSNIWNSGDTRYEVLEITDSNTGDVVWAGNDAKVCDRVMARFGGPSFIWEYVGYIETDIKAKVGWNTSTRFEEYRVKV